jgi:hypothetical protein
LSEAACFDRQFIVEKRLSRGQGETILLAQRSEIALNHAYNCDAAGLLK